MGRSGLSWVARVKRQFRVLPTDFASLAKALQPQLAPRSNHNKVVLVLITALKKDRNKSYPFLMGRSGLEPPTSPLSGVRSNHLSLQPLYLLSHLRFLSFEQTVLATLASAPSYFKTLYRLQKIIYHEHFLNASTFFTF